MPLSHFHIIALNGRGRGCRSCSQSTLNAQFNYAFIACEMGLKKRIYAKREKDNDADNGHGIKLHIHTRKIKRIAYKK